MACMCVFAAMSGSLPATPRTFAITARANRRMRDARAYCGVNNGSILGCKSWFGVSVWLGSGDGVFGFACAFGVPGCVLGVPKSACNTLRPNERRRRWVFGVVTTLGLF